MSCHRMHHFIQKFAMVISTWPEMWRADTWQPPVPGSDAMYKPGPTDVSNVPVQSTRSVVADIMEHIKPTNIAEKQLTVALHEETLFNMAHIIEKCRRNAASIGQRSTWSILDTGTFEDKSIVRTQRSSWSHIVRFEDRRHNTVNSHS